MERKEKPLKISCQNPVEHARRMMQYNFRRLEPNLFSGHFDMEGTFWSADMHTVQLLHYNDARG